MATPTLDEIEAQIRTLCGAAPSQDGYVCGDVEAAGNIAMALVAHVRELDASVRTGAERRRALEAKVAALEKDGTAAQKKPDALRAAAERECDRLRAENAELRAANGKLREENGSLHTAKIDWEEENAELRKRVEAGTWPAPQPIETAPLGRTVFWYGIAFKEWRCFAVTAEDMDEVRAGYSHWIPMPPPPGGGK